MTQAEALYLQVNFVCLFVFWRLLKAILFDYNFQYETKLFSRVLLSTAIFTFSDMGWILFTTLLFPGNLIVNWTVNLVYFIASAFIGITWFNFCEYIIGVKLDKMPVLAFISYLPFLVLFILVISSPFTHLIFYIDSDNVYHRGSLYSWQVFCMNIYFVITGIQGFFKIFDRNDIGQRRKYFSICCLMIYAFIAQLLQVIFPGYPLIEIGLNVSLLGVFVEVRNSIISIDPLTQINNRGQLLRYLSTKFKSFKEHDLLRSMYLMILDVDSFKEINDLYGHIEGDEALKLVANSLKKVAANNNYFICRYGGDEFVLVCEKENDSEAEKVKNQIKQTVEEAGNEKNKAYTLSVSIGYAKRDLSTNTAADLIKNADAFMYKNKKSKKVK